MATERTVVDGRFSIRESRVRGEMLHATSTRAEIPAGLLEDGANSGWLDHVRPITITIALRQGYSGRDHLFDRTIQRVAEAVAGRLFLSTASATKAAQGHSHGDGEYTVDVAPVIGAGTHTLPADREEEAESLREPLRRKEASKAKRSRAKFARALGVTLGADGQYRVTTADAHARGHWVDAVGGTRYWYCEGAEIQQYPHYLGISSGAAKFATTDEATALLTSILERHG